MQSVARMFTLVGAVLWLVVTVASVATVIKAPAENVGLAIFIVLIWIVLIVLGAVSWLTERLGSR